MLALFFLILFVLSFEISVADNNDVVVFVHGLADDANTWDYEQEILESGLRSITVSLSPFESRYDRAIGLYARLKGLPTDYGACHSRKFKHLQFGEDFTGKGLYPDWDENHKVHFVGHSLGGLTITSLERLLEFGNDCDEDTNTLFKGGKKWITSITTLATPHDGTTILDQIPLNADELAFNLLVRFGAEATSLTFPQFGLYPEEGERNRQYYRRLKESGIFYQDDFSFYDLRIPPALQWNSEGPAIVNKDTYYFAYALDRTSPSEDCFLFFFSCDPVEDPDSEMTFLLKVPAQIMGAQSPEEDRPNDGIVNRDRARCPNEDKSECIQVEDDVGTWKPGQWQYVNVGYLDHFQITARDSTNDNENFAQSAKRIYLQLGLRLKSLPSTSSKTLSPEEELRRRNMAEDVALYLEAVETLTLPYEPRKHKMSAGEGFVLILFVVGSILTVGYVASKKISKSSKVEGNELSASEEGKDSSRDKDVSV